MAVAVQTKEIEIEAMKWGMVIPNTTDMVVNGRIEDITQKPFFRNLLERKRCVLTLNGYYEWKEPEKTPYLLAAKELNLNQGKFEFLGS